MNIGSLSTSDDRVLSFFVSGALLAGVASCSKEAEPDDPSTSSGHVDTGQNVSQVPKDSKPDTDPLSNSIDAGLPVRGPGPEKMPDRVNTNHQMDPTNPEFLPKPDVKELESIPPPAPPKKPNRVNTNYQKDPTTRARKPRAKKEFRTNVGWIEKAPADKPPKSK